MVKNFYDPSTFDDPDHPDITIDNLPDFTGANKLDLEPGTAYKFRVAAINTCGRGPWSEVSSNYKNKTVYELLLYIFMS